MNHVEIILDLSQQQLVTTQYNWSARGGPFLHSNHRCHTWPLAQLGAHRKRGSLVPGKWSLVRDQRGELSELP